MREVVCPGEWGIDSSPPQNRSSDSRENRRKRFMKLLEIASIFPENPQASLFRAETPFWEVLRIRKVREFEIASPKRRSDSPIGGSWARHCMRAAGNVSSEPHFYLNSYEFTL